jgi:TolB protein
LTFEGSCNDTPEFSPSGESVAFVTRGHNGDFQVCTIGVTGEAFTVLEQNGSNENPDWAPDGWHLVYSKQTGSERDLYIMDRFGKRAKRITSDGKSFSPTWQPFSN